MPVPAHSLSDSSSLQDRLQQLRNLLPELEQQAEELNKSRHLQTALFEISELCHSEDDMGAFFQGLHQTIASLT